MPMERYMSYPLPRTQAAFVQPDSTCSTSINQDMCDPSLCSLFAQALVEEKCCTEAELLLFIRWSAFLTSSSWGDFHTLLASTKKKKKMKGRCRRWYFWITEALQHIHCTLVYLQSTFQWSAHDHVKYCIQEVVQFKAENKDEQNR